MAHLDEFGMALRATIVVPGPKIGTTKPLDLTGATITFLIRKPSGVVVEVEAEIVSASKGIAEYVIPDDELLDVVGRWEWQPKIETASLRLFGPLSEFTVDRHLIATP